MRNLITFFCLLPFITFADYVVTVPVGNGTSTGGSATNVILTGDVVKSAGSTATTLQATPGVNSIANAAVTTSGDIYRYTPSDTEELQPTANVISIINGVINTNIVTINAGYGYAIPLMTSSNAPYGNTFSSGEFSSSHQAWEAFNRLDGNANYWAAPAGQLNAWVGYQTISPIVPVSFYYHDWSGGSIGFSTTNYVEASADGVTWNVLFNTNYVTYFYSASGNLYGTNAYSYFRLRYKQPSSTGNFGVSQFQIWGVVGGSSSSSSTGLVAYATISGSSSNAYPGSPLAGQIAAALSTGQTNPVLAIAGEQSQFRNKPLRGMTAINLNGWQVLTNQMNILKTDGWYAYGYNTLCGDFGWNLYTNISGFYYPIYDSNMNFQWATNYPLGAATGDAIHALGFKFGFWLDSGEQQLVLSNFTSQVNYLSSVFKADLLWIDDASGDYQFIAAAGMALRTNGTATTITGGFSSTPPTAAVIGVVNDAIFHGASDAVNFSPAIQSLDNIFTNNSLRFVKEGRYASLAGSGGDEWTGVVNGTGIGSRSIFSALCLCSMDIIMWQDITGIPQYYTYATNSDLLNIQWDVATCNRVANTNGIWILQKESSGVPGVQYLEVLNTSSNTPTTVSINLSSLPIPQGSYRVYDNYSHTYLSNGVPLSSWTVYLLNTDSAVYTLKPVAQSLFATPTIGLGQQQPTISLASGALQSTFSLFDDDTVAYINATKLTNYVSDPIRLAADYIVKASKAAGLWNRADCIALFCSDTNASQVPIKGAYPISWFGGATFGTNGVTGNGSTAYGYLGGFNFSTAANYQSNNASLFVWNNSAPSIDGGNGLPHMFVGGVNGSQQDVYRSNGGATFDVGGVNYTGSTTNNFGAWATSISNGVMSYYWPANGSGTASGSKTGTATAMPNVGACFLAWTNAGNGIAYNSSASLRGVVIGSSITANDFANWQTIFAAADAYLKKYQVFTPLTDGSGLLNVTASSVASLLTNNIVFTSASLITNTLGYDGTALVSSGTTVVLKDRYGNTLGTVGTVGSVNEVIPMRSGMILSGTSMSGVIY
jgi:hypothetical protein